MSSEHPKGGTGLPPATAGTPQTLPKGFDRRPIDLSSVPSGLAVTTLDFDVTENCNLGCVYCFKGEMYSKSMSLATMQRTLDWLIEASGAADTIYCNFMGGEPTMRFKQLRSFVPWAIRRAQGRNKIVRFSMTTNLTLWNEELREFVDRYGFGVLMSIDGCPDVQDAQRPAKNGKKVSETVEYWAKSLLRTRPNSTARATLHPSYVARLAESVEYIQSLGFREMAVSASEYESWTSESFDIFEGQLEDIVNGIYKKLEAGIEFNLTVFKYYINKLIHRRRTGREGEIEFQHQPCGAGRGYMMVDYTGDIWPCHRFDGADTDASANGSFRLGNIHAPGLNDKLRQSFLDFDHQAFHKPDCESCPVNPTCGGYCPAANLSDTGSIYTPHEAFCRWSALVYSAASELYERCRNSGGKLFVALLKSSEGTESSGEE